MPKANIDGTQMPIKVAFCFSPEKNKISEQIRDNKAETNNNLSAIVNFLNMCRNYLMLIDIIYVTLKKDNCLDLYV